MNWTEKLEQKAKAAGTNLTEACKRAGVHRGIPAKWKSSKHTPMLETYEKIDRAIDEIAAERLVAIQGMSK